MRSRSARLLALAASAGLFSTFLLAQEGGPAEEPAEGGASYELAVGESAGAPGKEVSLPVFFTRRPGTPNVKEVRLRLTYPNAAVKYSKVEDAYLAKRAGLQIEDQYKTAADQDVLEVVFTLPNPEEKEFPSGQVAYLHFTIAEDAKDGPVHLQSELWMDGKPVAPSDTLAQVKPGKILVSASPILVGCFFFTH